MANSELPEVMRDEGDLLAPDLKVVTLRETSASDIAAMLRECADSIDKGAKPKSIVAVATEDDGSISIYGWGATDSMDTLATLQLAILQHGQSML